MAEIQVKLKNYEQAVKISRKDREIYNGFRLGKQYKKGITYARYNELFKEILKIKTPSEILWLVHDMVDEYRGYKVNWMSVYASMIIKDIIKEYGLSKKRKKHTFYKKNKKRIKELLFKRYKYEMKEHEKEGHLEKCIPYKEWLKE